MRSTQKSINIYICICRVKSGYAIAGVKAVWADAGPTQLLPAGLAREGPRKIWDWIYQKLEGRRGYHKTLQE